MVAARDKQNTAPETPAETESASDTAKKTTAENDTSAEGKQAADKQTADAEIAALMAKVTATGDLDQAAQDRLLVELKKAPRNQRSLIVNMVLASLHQTRPPAQAKPAAETAKKPVDDFVVIAPAKDTAPPAEAVAAQPTPPAQPARLPQADAPRQEPTPTQDPLALSNHNVLRAGEPKPNSLRPSRDPSADQPPSDPPPKSSRVQLASAEGAGPRDSAYMRSTSWRASLDQTIELLEQGTSKSADHDPATQTRLRLMYLAADRRSDAGREIPGVSEDAKAYWSEQLYSLGVLLDDETTPNARQRATRAAHHARAAAYRLGQMANLIVRNMALTTAVHSFGVYDELNEYRVAPGQEVILYAELENFTSEETAKGYHTSLKASYEILDRRGKKIASETLGDSEEHCRNLRRDFFVAYSVIIPRDLFNGDEYTLRLNIEDAKSQRVGESIVKFRVQQ